jgi:hypothetical protein
MKQNYFLAAFLACSIGFSAVVPAYAGLPVKSIYSSRAEGSGGATSLASITVWPGYGTNLSLISTGEVIRRAWLDNPSRIVLDSDGGLTGSGGQNSGSQSSSSQVLHLKQIQPLAIPGITKAPSTMLTLIVDGPSGKKIYQFQVIVAKGSPQYHTLSVLPNSKPANTSITASSASSDAGVSVEDVRQGLQVVIRKGWAPANSRLIPKVQSFISQIQNGETAKAASGSSGISMALVSRLENLGKQSTVAIKDSSTTPSQWGSDQTEGTAIASLPPTAKEQKPESSASPVAQNSSLEKKNEPTPAALPQVVPTPAPPVASDANAQPAQITQSQPAPSPASVAIVDHALLKQPIEATDYVKKGSQGSPRQILSKIQIPLEDGRSVTAEKLLDIQSRIWTLKRGAYRKTFGYFLNALVNSEKAPEARLQEALKRTGNAFTLNDVQWLLSVAVQKKDSETSSIQGVAP